MTRFTLTAEIEADTLDQALDVAASLPRTFTSRDAQEVYLNGLRSYAIKEQGPVEGRKPSEFRVIWGDAS